MFLGRVADSNPDPAFYLNANPDPTFRSNADPASKNNADPVPDPSPGLRLEAGAGSASK